MSQDHIFSPTDFVAVLNQTLEFAYPSVLISGEVTDFRVRKNRWVYFKLVDEHASVSFFGTVYQLQHELRDGMMVQVRGYPRLHPLYGFSVQVQFLQPVGEGSIKKSADLLMDKLKKEGVFDPANKRPVPFPPQRIGLITSSESAAYQDFLKILNNRWGGLDIDVADVHVQGESSMQEIADAITFFNQTEQNRPDVLVLTRGGGSLEDLAAFSTETVTRAVAASAIPTVVAIGHETDVSLAELAADMRASTPSNAAELLVPQKSDALAYLSARKQDALVYTQRIIAAQRTYLEEATRQLATSLRQVLANNREDILRYKQLAAILHPYAALNRGYAIIKTADGSIVTSGAGLAKGQPVSIVLRDTEAQALIQSTKKKKAGKL